MHTGNRCSKITRAEVFEAKFSCIDIVRRKTEFCVVLQFWCTNSFKWSDLKESFSPIFIFLRWKLAHVVSSRDTAYLWDKILRVTLKPGSTRYSQVRTWEERSTCCSAQRISGLHTNAGGVHTNKNMDIGKPRVANGSDNSGDVSLRDACLGKPRVCAKRSFTPSNVESRRKGSSGKGMKGGYNEAHKTITREVHFDALMDIRWFISTRTLPGSVRKNKVISSREK